jgi:demethylmenaquinone methyltransferase/2-methoxy-6-polyprenyl-1,4-benzoquinol methylase
MLAAGRQKIDKLGLSSRIRLLQGNALELPFPDEVFDCAGIAFGIRNIPQKFRALQEMTRVVVPGGRVVVLEMTFPRHRYIQSSYDLYLNRLLPRMAGIFSPNPRAYSYLGDSILNFPGPPELARLMASAGLEKVEIFRLTLGIAHLHVGGKPGGNQ